MATCGTFVLVERRSPVLVQSALGLVTVATIDPNPYDPKLTEAACGWFSDHGATTPTAASGNERVTPDHRREPRPGQERQGLHAHSAALTGSFLSPTEPED